MFKIIITLVVVSLIWTQNAGSHPQNSNDNKVGPSTIVPLVKTKAKAPANCTMPSGEMGVCVAFYLCDKHNNVITDGRTLIDIRSSVSHCPSSLDVCCLPPKRRGEDNPTTPCPEVVPKRQGCGWRNPKGIGFEITGHKDGEAQFGEFPWMVAVLNDGIEPRIEPVKQDSSSQKMGAYLGGGSLLHPSVVLTGAHVVAGIKAVRVRAGEWDTKITTETYPHQDRKVTSMEMHKDFDNDNLSYDIALLFLKSPMNEAPNVGVVCLPPPQQITPHGRQCLASGWGKDKFESEENQTILKKVEVPAVERDQCADQLKQTRLGYFFELHSSFMCAGGEAGKDTCRGDGGSPLVCPIESQTDRYAQSGIVAWGIGCGEEGIPAVYVDVGKLRDWIDNKVAAKGFDTKVYTY